MKVVPQAALSYNTFMHVFFEALQTLHPDTKECSLVDVTAHATELGIVRDGMLRHTAHTAHGAISIAHDVAALTEVPLEEAMGYVRENGVTTEQSLSASKQEEITGITDTYEANLEELFNHTGDSLSIPKSIFMHTDARTEAFFTKHIKKAAKQSTDITHVVHPITSALLGKQTIEDSALLLSAFVFHTGQHKEQI